MEPLAVMERSSTNPEPTVIETREARDLQLISQPHVRAVVYHPPRLPDWLGELAAAVRTGAFRVPRTFVNHASRERLRCSLESDLPSAVISTSARRALVEDILSLADLCAGISGSDALNARYLTNSPNPDCGYHVDTVRTDAPVPGVLRVYCGTGSEYPDPANVTSLADFYRYVYRRDQLTRRIDEARASGDGFAYERALAERSRLDRDPPFLERSREIRRVPAGCIVAMRYESARWLWSDHLLCTRVTGWIHRSPMEGGEARFLVNINAA